MAKNELFRKFGWFKIFAGINYLADFLHPKISRDLIPAKINPFLKPLDLRRYHLNIWSHLGHFLRNANFPEKSGSATFPRTCTSPNFIQNIRKRLMSQFQTGSRRGSRSGYRRRSRKGGPGGGPRFVGTLFYIWSQKFTYMKYVKTTYNIKQK